MNQGKRQQFATVGTLALLTVFFTVLYLMLASNVEQYSRNRLRTIATHAATLVNDWFVNYGISVELAAASGRAPLTSQQTFTLFSKMASTEACRNMALLLEGQGLFFFDDQSITHPSNSAEHYAVWFRALSQPMETTRIEGPLPAPSGTGYELLASKALINANGQRFGALALRLPLTLLTDKLHHLDFLGAFDRQVLILSQSGEILAPTDGDGNLRSLLSEPALAPLQHIVTAASDTVEILRLGDRDYFVGKAAIGDTAWQVLLLSPTVHELQILPVLRVGLLVAWTCLSAFIVFILSQTRKYGYYKILSELDHLTGTGNRLAFEKALTRLHQSRQFPVSLLMMDVDGLKMMNDSLGHEAGDALLRRVAGLLQRSLRDHDAIYRIGGDEFAVIIPGASRSAALPLVDRINTNATASREKTTLPPIYISYGLEDAQDNQELSTLYRRADEAMYNNKNIRRSASSTALRQWLKENPVQEERRNGGTLP